jgi:hypothetical protein
MREVKDGTCNTNWTPSSGLWQLVINSLPQVSFTQAPNPVCANQKELLYEVTSLENVIYHWNINVNKGTIISSTTANLAIVNWKEVTAEGDEVLSVTVTDNSNGCEYVASQSIAILPYSAPVLNNIVAKVDKSRTPYILIYPRNNSTDKFSYQWYYNNVEIPGATDQFYYPENGLLSGEYKVYVSNLQSKSCGNYTVPYTSILINSASAELFTVYPNPSDGHFTVIFNKNIVESETNATISFFSSQGNKITEQRASCSEDFKFNGNIGSGTYLLKVETDNNMMETRQVIVK